MPIAPVRRGRVKSFRFNAAAGEAERMGRPAETWLKRPGVAFERAGAVVHPYLTPRLEMRGRRAWASARKEEGDWSATPSFESLGAIVWVVWCLGGGRSSKVEGR